jgi:hypothetical protein
LVYVRHQGPLAGVELTTFLPRDTTATATPRDEDKWLTPETINALHLKHFFQFKHISNASKTGRRPKTTVTKHRQVTVLWRRISSEILF